MKRSIALLLLLLLAGCNFHETPQQAYRAGVEALEQGDARTARIEFLNVLKAQPNNADVRLLQAKAYLVLKDGAAAEAEVERARQLGVARARTSPLMAHAFILQGRFADALQELQGADGGYAERLRGLAFSGSGNGDAATAAFERAIAEQPRDSDTWADVARFRRSTGDIAGALDAVHKAVSLSSSNVDTLTLQGELIRGQYGLRAALPWFDRAIEADPENVNARLERAATYGDLGQAKAMLQDTRKVLSLQSGNPMAFYLQAMLAARAHNYPLARSLYQRTAGKLDSQPAAMLLAATIAYGTGDFEAAADRLSRLIDLQPDNLKARRLLAASQWKMKDLDGAIATLQPIVRKADADSYSLALMGNALAARGDAKAASVYLTRAAQPQQQSASALLAAPADPATLAALRADAAENPGDAGLQIKLIRALLSTGLGPEALQRARGLQAAHPGVPDVHLLVGDALGIDGNFAAAAEQYRKAANIAFSEPVAMRLIEALDQSNQEAAAERVLSLFLQQNPGNVPAQLLAGSRAMDGRQWDRAIAVYEALRKRIGDTDAAMLNNLAWAYSEQGDTRRALPLANKALALDPNNPATADTLGWLLIRTGSDRARGLALLQQAVRGAPSNLAIRAHLAAARRS